LFVPVKTASQLICGLRLSSALSLIVMISFNSPENEIEGEIGGILKELIPECSFTYLNIFIPTLIVEVLTNVLFLVGVGQHSRPWLIPWLVINILFFIMLLFSMVFFGAPLMNLGEEEEMMTDEEKLSSFKKNLRVVWLALFSYLQLSAISCGLKQFLDMRYKRRISFSKKVQKKELPKVSSYEDASEKGLIYPSLVETSPLFDNLSQNPNYIVNMDSVKEGTKSDSWDEKDTISFSYDKEENFS